MDVNYFGPVALTKALKHALKGFFESLRAEMYPQGVRVTFVVPGFIRTSITKHAITGQGTPYGRQLGVHERGMTPERCADRIVRAAAAGRGMALIGKGEIASVYLNRLAPGLLSKIIRSHPVRTKERWLAKLPWRRRRP